MAKIVFPSQMSKLTYGKSQVELNADSLGRAFDQLVQLFPGLSEVLIDVHGNVAPFIKVFVRDNQVSPGEFSDLKLQDDDIVTIIAAVAGG